jgi:hypothetical protein
MAGSTYLSRFGRRGVGRLFSRSHTLALDPIVLLHGIGD